MSIGIRLNVTNRDSVVALIQALGPDAEIVAIEHEPGTFTGLAASLTEWGLVPEEYGGDTKYVEQEASGEDEQRPPVEFQNTIELIERAKKQASDD